MALEDQAGGLDSLDVGVPTTETISIGGAKMPLKTVLNSDILKNLQDELDRRTGKGVMGGIDQILQGFKENAAFTSRDPSQAFAALNADKRAEAQDVMGLRNNIAAIKQAQMLHDVQSKGLNNLVNGAGGSGAGAGLASEIDPATMSVVRTLMAQGDIAGAQAVYQKAIANLADAKNKFAFNPASYAPQNVQLGGQSYDLNPIELQALQKMPPDVRAQWLKNKRDEMTGAYNAPEENTPPAETAPVAPRVAPQATATAPKTAPVPQARLVLENGKAVRTPEQYAAEVNAERDSDAASKKSRIQRYSEGYNALLEEQTRNAKQPTAQSVSKTPQNAALSAIKIKPLTERDVYPGQPPAATQKDQEDRRARVKYLNEKQTEAALADVAVERELKKREREHAQDIGKRELEKGQDVVSKELETSAAGAGKREAELMERGKKAETTALKADELVRIANDPKRNRIFALTETTPVAKTLTNVAEFVPGVGREKAKRVIESMSLNNNEKSDLATVDSHSKQIGLEAAANMVAASHLGVGVEKLALGAKGVGSDLPWQNNVKQGQLIKDLSQAVADERNLWIDYKKSNPKATFSEFERSDELKALTDKNRADLITRYKGIVVPVSNQDKFAKFRKPAQ